MEDYYIDLHCHPSLKPYGKSFRRRDTKRKNNRNANRVNSIWHDKRARFLKKALNIFATLTKFTQADFSSVLVGGGKVIMASLYPMEKNMILDKNGVKFTGRLARNLATGISTKRIRHLQRMKDYFKDLEDEYKFYLGLHDTLVNSNGIQAKYKLVDSFADINFDEDTEAVETIYVVMTIEGCHVFNTGLQLAGRPKADPVEVIANIEKVKQWQFKPFFVGLAHHFDNEICGHAKSITGLVDKIIKQKVDENQGITDLGEKVINTLLSTSNGKRIHIDLKHMNVKSRYEYYDYLATHFATENIPLIVSHGACNGIDNPRDNNETYDRFNSTKINFYDEELVKIEASNGIFGIQLDERRVMDKKKEGGIFKNTNIGRRKMLKVRSRFIWRQIQHAATVLDDQDKDAWNIQALGTDFDGIIDPLNGWWTSRELSFLDIYLEKHAAAFLRGTRGKQLKAKNKLSPELIINKFMYQNAKDFMEKFYI